MAVRTKKRQSRKTYDEECWDIIHKYIDDGNEWPAPMKKVARWAIGQGLAVKRVPTMEELFARDLSKAARKEYITDPQQRRVRRFHAFRKDVEIGEEHVQYTLWTDITTAAPEDMQLALQQRRMCIVGDCKQLKTDTDSYNENNPHGAEIQMSMNFEHDVADASHSTEYNPGTFQDDDVQDSPESA